MTNLGSILKSRDITLSMKVCLVRGWARASQCPHEPPGLKHGAQRPPPPQPRSQKATVLSEVTHLQQARQAESRELILTFAEACSASWSYNYPRSPGRIRLQSGAWIRPRESGERARGASAGQGSVAATWVLPLPTWRDQHRPGLWAPDTGGRPPRSGFSSTSLLGSSRSAAAVEWGLCEG